MKIFLTGATGVMGMQGMRRILDSLPKGEEGRLTILARQTKRNRNKLAPFIRRGINVIWGDLTNALDVEQGVRKADIVLHVGGMVSPLADWQPEKTYKVNTTAMANIISAAKKCQQEGKDIKVVYIGSVAQYGNRPEGAHWGRTGDPVNVSSYDMYALSKCEAERMLAESGLRRWVSLRQTGIIYPAILMKASDPIAFHVPVRGCLEWVTADDSGRLLASLCRTDLPDSFWNSFYNIGGGASYRVTNYDLLKITMNAVGCPPPSKSFKRNWFATRNFHGMWYTDSDYLDSLLHFRSGEPFPSYVKGMTEALPWYFRLAPLAPAFLIRTVMGKVAQTKVLGPMRWIMDNNEPRIKAAFGSREVYESLPSWEEDEKWSLSDEPQFLDHGYDEGKDESELTIEDMRQAAQFRGGECVSTEMCKGRLDQPLEWKCADGHLFKLTPRTVLKGGHWCPECLRLIARDSDDLYRQAEKNHFLAQIVDKGGTGRIG